MSLSRPVLSLTTIPTRQKKHYFEAIIGLHRGYTEFIRITDMDDLLNYYCYDGEDDEPLFKEIES
jgi:hypothetical protein